MNSRNRRATATLFLILCAGLLWTIAPYLSSTAQANPASAPSPLSATRTAIQWAAYTNNQFCFTIQHPENLLPRQQTPLSAEQPYAQVQIGDSIHIIVHTPPLPGNLFQRFTQDWTRTVLADDQAAFQTEFLIPPLEAEGTESRMAQLALHTPQADYLLIAHTPGADEEIISLFQQMASTFRILSGCNVDAPIALSQPQALTDGFDFPANPRDGSSGRPPEYASYNKQNGSLQNCGDSNGDGKDDCWSTCYNKWLAQLQHAGEDWFRGAGSPVYAVANGRVIWSTYANWPGAVVIIEHELPAGISLPWGGNLIYSFYGHLSTSGLIPQWAEVQRGQQIGVLYNWGSNSHTHFELRRYGNMEQAPQWVNGRFFCNTAGWPGPGYTDTDAHPDWFGYTHPSGWIDSHRPGGTLPTATPTFTPRPPTATPTSRPPTATPTPGSQEIAVLEAWPQGATFSRGQTFHPRVVVQTSGFSLNCGENYLENRDGNLYGAHFMQGCVDQGGNRYQFAFGDPPMTAPGSSGTYHSQWQIWRWPNHIGPLIDLWFVVESSPPNCDPHPDRAILYSQTNFGGACVSLGPGDYPNPGHLNPVGNDNTRSLRVGQNVRLTLYENDNYQGRQSNFDTSEVHDLRDAEIGYDTSSARVEQKPPTATPTPPATATPTPPPDGEAPTISWIAPVADGQIYHVSGELVRLQVEATDNVSVSQVHFSRWDAVQEVVVDLVDRFSPPYQMDLDTSSLNYEWNEIRATAYDAVGNQRSATIWLFRDTVAPTPTNTPTPQTATCPGVISGWKGEYWNNESLSGSPVVCRDDASINFDWLDNPPDPRVPVNHFSARWTRTLSFPAGTYRFDVFHDDGARLYIDGVLVLDNWCDNCRVTDSIRHDLSAGNHIIRLEVRENIGWAAAWLGWQTITPPDAFHLLLPILARASAPVSLPLVNGDFDQGSGSGWREFSAHNWPVLVHSSNLPIAPYSGEWAAWLGGEYDEVAFIEQSVIVPSDSSILRFAYWIASEDQCGFDFGGVVLNGGTVVEVFDLCAAQATDNWAWRFVDLHAYAGQQVSLQIRAETDSTLNSNLFVDNVHWSSQTVNPAQITLDPQNRPTPTPIQASRHPRDLQKAATLQLFVPRADTNSILPQHRLWAWPIGQK